MRLIMTVLIVLLFSQSKLASQTNAGTFNFETVLKTLHASTPSGGSILIVHEPQTEQLLNKYIEYRASNNIIPVYRIRIYSKAGNSARKEGQEEGSRFSSLYPNLNPHLLYEAPNFKVYVGDFRNQVEAFIALKKIKHDFPNAFIVNQPQKKLYN